MLEKFLSNTANIATCVAIFIFLARELIEIRRTKRNAKYKSDALMHLLARECELNYLTICEISTIVLFVGNYSKSTLKTQIGIELKPSGNIFAFIRHPDGYIIFERAIPAVHRNLISNAFIDIATANRKLFEAIGPAYEALIGLEHVRLSLIKELENSTSAANIDVRTDFIAYTQSELQDILHKLDTVYAFCTGTNLESTEIKSRLSNNSDFGCNQTPHFNDSAHSFHVA